MFVSTSIAWLLTEVLLLFQLFFYTAAYNLHIPSVNNRHTVSQYTLSSGVDIPCTIEAYSLPNLTWYYNSSVILSPNSIDTVVNNGTIQLHSTLTVVETGVYHCTATGDLGSIRSHDILVELFEIPDFIHPDVSAITLRHNWSVILPCLFTPLPYFSVTWWYNGNKLRSQSTRYISHSGNLHVYEATFRSNGSYHCTVRNQITNETFTGPTLHLLVTTVDLQIINLISEIPQSDTVYVSSNSDVNLEYNQYYQPLYNITWLYPIQSGSPMVPVIPNINTSTNYTVVVFLDTQKKHSVEIQIKIVSLPVVEMNLPSLHYICNDDSITLSCDVTNAIPPTNDITWYHNGEYVHAGDLLVLTTAAAGYYQCVAENEIAAVSASTLLLYPDDIELSITAGPTLFVSFGSPLQLTCEDIHGVTNTSIWIHELTELSNTSQLLIPYVTSDNIGGYTCVAYVCGYYVGNVTIEIDVSDPVIRLTQLFNSPCSVDISWPSHPRAVNYTLEYQRADNVSWQVLQSTRDLYFIEQLQRDVNYTFRVTYTLLTADGDQETQSIISESIQLDYVPVITRITPLTSTQVLIHWEWEGDITTLNSFVIRYEQRNEVKNVTLLTSELSTTSDFFETVLSELRTNSNYSFVIYGVKASEDVWNTPYSLTGYLTTLPAELEIAPADLRIIYLPSSNSISILYSLINVTQEFGDVLGYKILLYVSDSPYTSTVYTQGPSETSRTVPLIPGQYFYYIRVLGFTLAGDGPVSEVYFSQPGYTTVRNFEMTSPPANSTMGIHPLVSYLPYLIGIPVSVLVTCIVLVLVVIGKCVHMYHLNGIKEEADGVKFKRYYEAQTIVKRNITTSDVMLLSENKSINSMKPSLSLPGRDRSRSYQVATSAEATGSTSVSQQINPISIRKIPQEIESTSFGHQKTETSFMPDVSTSKEPGFVQSKPFKTEVKFSKLSNEFAV